MTRNLSQLGDRHERMAEEYAAWEADRASVMERICDMEPDEGAAELTRLTMAHPDVKAASRKFDELVLEGEG